MIKLGMRSYRLKIHYYSVSQSSLRPISSAVASAPNKTWTPEYECYHQGYTFPAQICISLLSGLTTGTMSNVDSIRHDLIQLSRLGHKGKDG